MSKENNRSTEDIANKEFFYSNLDNFKFSYSSLLKLINNPKVFREEYVYGNKDTRTASYFDIGKLIHCMVLEPEMVEKRYIRLLNEMAEGNTKDCVKHVFDYACTNNKGKDLTNYSSQILAYLQLVNLHQSLKTDQQRIDKICTEAACEYFETLFKANTLSLEIVSNDHFIIAMEKAQAIMNDEYSNLLLKHLNKGDEWVNELELEVPKDKLKTDYGLKGIIDRIKFNNEKKEIFITDIKSSSKTLDEFKDSANKYMYPLQAVIYKKLLESFIEGDIKEWKIYIHFTVVDKFNNVYSFPLSEETLSEHTKLFHNYLGGEYTGSGIAQYQITTEQLDLAYKYVTRQVSL
jgi:hypothetical protein